jgi:GPH family glycoside/pentoside/hexuronide:cation symporter
MMGDSYMEKKKHIYTLKSMRYGLTNGFSTWISTIASTYWAVYLTGAVGLETKTMAAIISAAGFVDMISVPFIGAIMQKAKFKSGKFRPWLMIGAILAALFRVLSFSNPNLSGAAKGLWFGAAYVLCYIGYNMCYSAYIGSLPLLAKDRDERQAYSASKNICNSIGKFLFSLFSVKLISLFGNGDEARGYTLFAVLIAVCVVLAYFQLFVMMKGIDVVQEAAVEDNTNQNVKEQSKTEDSYNASVWQMIKYTITKPFILFVLGVTTKTAAFFTVMGLAAYYYTYVVGNKNMLTVYLSLSTFIMIFGSYIAPFVSKAINSLKKSYALGLGIYGGSFALAYFFGKSGIAFTVLLCVGYVGYSISHTTEITLYSSIVDYTQWKTGKDLKPFMMSMFNILPKIGTAIGNTVLGYGLVAIGFQKENVTASAAGGLRVLFSALPAAILFIGVVVFLLFPLTDEKIKRMQEDIKAGRTKDSK